MNWDGYIRSILDRSYRTTVNLVFNHYTEKPRLIAYYDDIFDRWYPVESVDLVREKIAGLTMTNYGYVFTCRSNSNMELHVWW